jgi:hypothetical protein
VTVSTRWRRCSRRSGSRRASLVTSRKERSAVYYSLASPHVADLLAVARLILTGVLSGQAELLQDLRGSAAGKRADSTVVSGDPALVGAENLCHQAILMNHASGTVAPLDPELIQVGDAIGQRAQRRGLVQGSVRPVLVAEIRVLAQHDHQMPLIPYQGPV